MVDLDKLRRDFKQYCATASLPELILLLEILTDECASRGQRARDYVARHFFDAAAQMGHGLRPGSGPAPGG